MRCSAGCWRRLRCESGSLANGAHKLRGYERLVAAGIDDWVGGKEDRGDGASIGAFGLAAQLDGASMFADDALGDPEAEAGAAFALGGEEGHEEVLAVFGEDARAVVGNLDDGSGFEP